MKYEPGWTQLEILNYLHRNGGKSKYAIYDALGWGSMARLQATLAHMRVLNHLKYSARYGWEAVT